MVENSSSSPSNPVAEVVVSPTPSNVAPVTQPTERELELQRTRETLTKVYSRPEEKLAHPVAPNVTAPEPPPGIVPEAQVVETSTNCAWWNGTRISTIIQSPCYLSEDVVRTVDQNGTRRFISAARHLRARQGSWRSQTTWGSHCRFDEHLSGANRAVAGCARPCAVSEDTIKGETSEHRARISERASSWRRVRIKALGSSRRIALKGQDWRRDQARHSICGNDEMKPGPRRSKSRHVRGNNAPTKPRSSTLTAGCEVAHLLPPLRQKCPFWR